MCINANVDAKIKYKLNMINVTTHPFVSMNSDLYSSSHDLL